jgi:hypothetical protein
LRPHPEEPRSGVSKDGLRASLPLLSVTTPHRRSAVTDFRQYLESKLRALVARIFQLLDIVTGRAFFVFRGKAY